MKYKFSKYVLLSTFLVLTVGLDARGEWIHKQRSSYVHSIESSSPMDQLRISSRTPGIIDIDYDNDDRVDLQLDDWPIALYVLGVNSEVVIEGPVRAPGQNNMHSVISVAANRLRRRGPSPGSHVTVRGDFDLDISLDLADGGSVDVRNVSANNVLVSGTDACPLYVEDVDAKTVVVKNLGDSHGTPIFVDGLICDTFTIYSENKDPFKASSLVTDEIRIFSRNQRDQNIEFENVLAGKLAVTAYRDKQTTISLGEGVEILGDTTFDCRGGSRLLRIDQSAVVHNVIVEADGGQTTMAVAGVVEGDLQITSNRYAHSVRIAQEGFDNVFDDWEGTIEGDVQITSTASTITGQASAEIAFAHMDVRGSIGIHAERIPQTISTYAVIGPQRVHVDLIDTNDDTVNLVDSSLGEVELRLGRGDDEVTLDVPQIGRYLIDGGPGLDTVVYDTSCTNCPEFVDVEILRDLP